MEEFNWSPKTQAQDATGNVVAWKFPVTVIYSKDDPSVFEVKECARDRAPVSQWIWSTLTLIAATPLAFHIACIAVHALLLPMLAVFFALTADQYSRIPILDFGGPLSDHLHCLIFTASPFMLITIGYVGSVMFS